MKAFKEGSLCIATLLFFRQVHQHLRTLTLLPVQLPHEALPGQRKFNPLLTILMLQNSKAQSSIQYSKYSSSALSAGSPIHS